MKFLNHVLSKISGAILWFLLGSIVSLAVAAPSVGLELGKDLVFDRSKGNCLACHAIDGGELTGNIGPPLIAMKIRFPDKELLRKKIWDATTFNETSIMPPF